MTTYENLFLTQKNTKKDRKIPSSKGDLEEKKVKLQSIDDDVFKLLPEVKHLKNSLRLSFSPIGISDFYSNSILPHWLQSRLLPVDSKITLVVIVCMYRAMKSS